MIMFAVPENTVVLSLKPALPNPTAIVRSIAADRDRWAHLLRYDPDTRWSGLIERTDAYEVWLLSWLPGQRTNLHDHGGSEGAFTVVAGALTERVVRIGRGVDVLHSLKAGQTRVFGPRYVHQVSNETTDPAVSIHVFGPSRAEMTPYRLDPIEGAVVAEAAGPFG